MRKLAQAACMLVLPLVLASGAMASPPARFDVPFPDFDDHSTCPGLVIHTAFDGSVKGATFTDRNGVTVREILTAPGLVVTFSANGNTLTTRGPSVLHLTYENGVLTSTAITGLTAAVHVPGEGLVLLDAGRIVFAVTGGILAENGPHQLFGTGDHSAFCAALA